MKTALIVGGTAATGVAIVAGLRARGYQVTIYHRGTHEVPEQDDLEHIHGDPHQRGSIAADLAGLSWDVTVATYGRIRHIADELRGRTGHLVTISGTPVLGATHGVPTLDDERYEDEDNAPPGMGRLIPRIADTERAIIAAHQRGDFAGTVVRYPYTYGPYAVAPLEWHVIQRALDRRSRWIVHGGGLGIMGRCASPNAAEVALLAIDRPDVAGGEIYNAADSRQFTQREWIAATAAVMGHTFEFVDIPSSIIPLGNNAVPLAGEYSWVRRGDVEDGIIRHQMLSNRKARDELGYRDVVDPLDWLRETVEHWLANKPRIDGREGRLGSDDFDYAAEDALLAWWDGVVRANPRFGRQLVRPHPYAHPAEKG